MNNCYEFNSVLKDELYNFINFKRSLGLKYDKRRTRDYKLIDDYWIEHNITDIKITREIINDYIVTKNNESPDTYIHRVGALKQFSFYLNSKGYNDCELLDVPKVKYKRFIPYIYTSDEIIKIIDCIDKSDYENKDQISIIIKLLYCTGLRISEALNIKFADISKDTTNIVIRNSKNLNNRIIYLSNSMIEELKDYLSKRYLKDENWIFSKNNRQLTISFVEKFYRKILLQLGYTKRENGFYPRLHDLRHTFAVTTLDKMFKKGYDYYNVLPMLSTYMGHRDIKSTEYYITLTEWLSHETVEKLNDIYPNVIPVLGGDINE